MDHFREKTFEHSKGKGAEGGLSARSTVTQRGKQYLGVGRPGLSNSTGAKLFHGTLHTRSRDYQLASLVLYPTLRNGYPAILSSLNG